MIERQFLEMNSNVQRMMSNEENNYGCGNDNPNVNSNNDHQPKRKRNQRHTLCQIQELEAFFKECPHPDERRKRELSRQLGMELLQIKFWFQNKRTQLKSQHERQENLELRSENEKLRMENMRYREALSNRYCPTCGSTSMGDMSSDERHLRMENARLREEIDCIAAMAAQYIGKPLLFINSGESSSSSALPPPEP